MKNFSSYITEGTTLLTPEDQTVSIVREISGIRRILRNA
jgi:hypothetical protein